MSLLECILSILFLYLSFFADRHSFTGIFTNALRIVNPIKRVPQMKFSIRNAILASIALASVSSSPPAFAEEFKKTIMTGGPTGTYIQIGRDIDGLGKQCGMNLTVQESAGSLENIRALYHQKNTQLAIVQHDVLGWMKRFQSEDTEVSKIVDRTRLVFPLYNEEVHIVAKTEVKTLTDLHNRRVSVGGNGSGTSLTASLVLDLANVVPREILNLKSQDALEQLQAGAIDAFFYVAGAPIKLLSTDDIDGNAIHLVPIKNSAVTEVYTKTSVPGDTYSWQAEEVPLVAAKTVLMAYEFNKDKNAYHAAACDAMRFRIMRT